jgi:hypothetical protein
VRKVGVVSNHLEATADTLVEDGGVSDAPHHALTHGGAPDEEVVEDIEAPEGEPGRDMQREERVARDANGLVVGCQPGASGDALGDGCLRVGVKACSGKDAGGIDTDRGQVGDKAHDRPDVEFGCRELQHVQARGGKILV